MSVGSEMEERERDGGRHEEDNTRMDSSTLTACILVTFPTSHAERSPLNCSRNTMIHETLIMERETSREEEEEERRV